MASVKACSPLLMKRRFILGQNILLHTGKTFDRQLCKTDIKRQFSKQAQICGFTCREVGIPVPGGTLAGKWWEPNSTDGEKAEEIPPILCLHGWLDNAGSFDLILPLMMTPSTRYFCLDFPGHGLTTYCPDWWYDPHLEGVLAVRRVAKHFGWEKFSIMGHSMGAIVGFFCAAYFTDHVHKLIAMENLRPIPLHTTRPNMTRNAIEIMFQVEERMRKPQKAYSSYEEILETLYEGRQGTISKEGCAALLKRGATRLDSNHYSFSYNLRCKIPGSEGRTSLDLIQELAEEIESPVCFIKADPGNVYDTEENDQKFFSILRKNIEDKFEHHKVPGTHHFQLNDEHKLIAPIALEFLLKNMTRCNSR